MFVTAFCGSTVPGLCVLPSPGELFLSDTVLQQMPLPVSQVTANYETTPIDLSAVMDEK